MPGLLPVFEAGIAFGNQPSDPGQTFIPLPPNALIELSTKRGRADEKSETETGVMDWLLDNRSRAFDPDYSGTIGNLVPNPSFETNLAGYSAGSVALQRLQPGSIPGVVSGGFILQTGSTVAGGANDGCQGPGISLQPSTVYTMSYYARAGASNNGLKVDCQINTYHGATFLSYLHGGEVALSNSSWTRVVYTFTTDPTCDSGVLFLTLGDTQAAINATWYVDAVQLEVGAAASAYCDGSLPNCRWAGTPHASASYRGGPYYTSLNPVKQARLRVWDPTNMVQNGSFETGSLAPWTVAVGSPGAAIVDYHLTDVVHPSTGGYRMYTGALTSDYAIVSSYTDLIPVDPNGTYTYTAYFRKWTGTSPVSNSAMYLDCYNKDRVWINGIWASAPTPGATYPSGNFTPGSTFARYGGTYTPGTLPPETRYVIPVIWLQQGLGGTLTCGVVIDGIQLVPGASPLPLDNRMTYINGYYDIFRGDVEDWPQTWEGRNNTVGLSIVDSFDALNVSELSIDRPIELSGARINAILDAIGWPSGDRNIDSGQSLMQAMTDATNNQVTNALDLLKQVAQSEHGVGFVSGDGKLTFHDRHRRFKPPYNTSQQTFDNQPVSPELAYAQAKPRRRKQDIINYSAVSVEGGGTYTWYDGSSQYAYRRRAVSVNTILSNPNDAQSLATFLVNTYKDPITSWDSLVLEPQLDDLLWPQVLGRELGDRITINAVPPGVPGGNQISIDAVIEKIEHVFVQGKWTTTWRLGRADTSAYWVLGTSQLGTGTRLAY